MAGSIGKMTASLASVQNENTLALANLNFDFSLVKLEAPVEYTGLGQTISKKRKMDAEEGGLHKTARRLAALFGGILPETEHLFRAYGKRVSEISSMPTINPREDSDREGIFASHVGVDTASIWAAVTSGSAAIAVHLLACMLARMFTGPEAISVWVEIAQQQKRFIRSETNKHLYAEEYESAISASKQDITRTDLANWDASARAWLQSADEAKAVQHKQTMLILNNASLPVNTEPDTYTSVMKAWKDALEAMNNLVKGMPQRVQSGAALLAISSWHLYPDMAVFGSPGSSCVEVTQKDSIFDKSALLTLGLQQIRGNDTKSVYWSLPLACLQYYGHPVKTSRTVGDENSRISPQQFRYIVLGCLFASWKDFATTNDEGLAWIERLAAISQPGGGNRIRWLTYLSAAAQDLMDSDASERKAAHQLMNLGRRRSTLLYIPIDAPAPLFDMACLDVFLSLVDDGEERLRILRRLCQSRKLKHPTLLIRYKPFDGYDIIEYASPRPMLKDQAGTSKELKHVRWLKLSRSELASFVLESENFEQRLKKVDTGAVGESNSSSTSDLKDETLKPDTLINVQRIAERKGAIEKFGEICLPVAENPILKSNFTVDDENIQNMPSLIFSPEYDFLSAARDILQRLEAKKDLKDLDPDTTPTPQHFYAGTDLAALSSIVEPLEPLLDPILNSSEMEDLLANSKLHNVRLYTHISRSNHATVLDITDKLVKNLDACARMNEIYKLLPGATISTLVVSQSLSQARWIPAWIDTSTEFLRPHAFACVAMFDSGTCNLDPGSLTEVFAMSSGNSLYVAGAFPCDPYEHPNPTELRRVIGNVGRSGITFLISPPEVKVREADPERWMAINHNKFNGEPENHFENTSIHLSFTDYEISLITENWSRHIIDRAVVLVETLVSVYDGSSWVAEVDILKMSMSNVIRLSNELHSTHVLKNVQGRKEPRYEEALQQHPQLAATSVENWDELIEAPHTGCIAVRAHKNWVARLALTAVCVNQGLIPVILPVEVCWKCCATAQWVRRIPDGESTRRVALIY